MPVSALLMNYSPERSNDSIARDGVSPEHERPPMIFTLSEMNAHHTETDLKVDSQNFIGREQIDCSVSADNEFVFVSIKDGSPSPSASVNNDIEMCPLTELCNLLCDSSCKKMEDKQSADKSSADERMNFSKSCASDRRKFLSSMIADNTTSTFVDSNFTSEAATKENIFNNEKTAQDPIEKLKVSEALVRTSMMTSPAAYRRLAARKIEMELNAAAEHAEDNEYVPPRELLMFLVRYVGAWDT